MESLHSPLASLARKMENENSRNGLFLYFILERNIPFVSLKFSAARFFFHFNSPIFTVSLANLAANIISKLHAFIVLSISLFRCNITAAFLQSVSLYIPKLLKTKVTHLYF